MDTESKPEQTDAPYVPTPREREAAQRVLDRRANAAPPPRYKVTKSDGTLSIDPDHPDLACNLVLFCDMLGTGDTHFADGVLYQLANIAANGRDLTSGDLSTVIAFVRGIGPRDPTEALLATQMVAVHNATMIAARRLKGSETIDQQNSASNMLNKLARTFAVQVETLKRYRSTGEQVVKVQHVTVHDGGQAIVTDKITTGGGGGDRKSDDQPHELVPASAASKPDARGAEMLGHVEAVPFAVPSPGGEGVERVQVPRGTGRRAER